MNLHAELAEYPFVQYLDDVQLSDRLHDSAVSALVVACFDMGARLPYVCADPKANLLICQDLGHRSSQYGIGQLLARGNINHLVIYGHSDCEFSRSLVQGVRTGQAERELITKTFPTESQSAIRQYGRNLTRDERANWRRLNEWNVLNELKCSLLYRGVSERAYASQLKMHGWLYVAEENRLAVFDPNTRQFVSSKCVMTSPERAVKGLPAYSSRQPSDC